ncbi:GNAT family N-acetyltransferase [Franconibacter helveticus]|uniref:GNAT family N-acetyltransferase n=1 Tax=Franconibacter helveticus TaxID=357240 RepID=UPI00066C8979|nr:GNAT family N-acetyltransferase [Franconibacter helveticus]
MALPFHVSVMSAASLANHIDELADVLVDCVQGGASVSFMLPFAHSQARDFWHGVAQSAAREERVVIVAQDEAGRIVGTVQLITAQPDNQPHRADVSKLLVHRSARRGGVARELMSLLETEALKRGKNVLVLDTATGSDAERFYQRNEWQRAGEIPRYALNPDGSYCATTYFFKQL